MDTQSTLTEQLEAYALLTYKEIEELTRLRLEVLKVKPTQDN
jgi:hypothetical protein